MTAAQLKRVARILCLHIITGIFTTTPVLLFAGRRPSAYFRAGARSVAGVDCDVTGRGATGPGSCVPGVVVAFARVSELTGSGVAGTACWSCAGGSAGFSCSARGATAGATAISKPMTAVQLKREAPISLLLLTRS
jgi:hypothetical protein